MFNEINSRSPEPFRKMIYNEYGKVLTGQKERESADMQLGVYAKAVAGSMMAMSDAERNNLLVNIRTESPDLYKRVMELYMNNKEEEGIGAVNLAEDK